MNTIKNFLIVSQLIVLILFIVQPVYADTVIDNGVSFLKSKQDVSGGITGGFSAPSQWSAIAFAANGIDVATIKNPTNSLKDFLLTDIPNNGLATDWESRILAIVAMGDDPTNFGDVNYVQKLESFYNNNQIGDLTLLNDDFFALLALIASGNSANLQIKQDTLNFIIAHQASDGGFSWSPDTTCSYGAPTVDMTAAALQSLQTGKDNGLIHAELDNAIAKAKDYLLAKQNSDGGFPGWSGVSDADTTSWVLMAFNVLGMKDSSPALSAKNWLEGSQQLDGGFLGWGGTDSTTTAQALIALVGKGWILKIFTPSIDPSLTPTPLPACESTPVPTASATPTPTPTVTPTPTSTPTPTPTPTLTPTSILTPTPTSTPTPSSTPSPTPIPTILAQVSLPNSTPEILGEATSSDERKETSSPGVTGGKIVMFTIGVLFILGAFKFWKTRTWNL